MILQAAFPQCGISTAAASPLCRSI